MDPVVSVLVPFFNEENYLERCVISLFEQTYPYLEFIFVDDCSTDKSFEILTATIENYPKRKKQTHIIRNQKNLGLAACRNIVLSSATGEFITFVDADDWIELDMIRQMVLRQQETGADIVNVNALIHHKDNIIELHHKDFSNAHERKMHYIGFYPNISMVIWGRLIRRALYTENNIKNIEGCNYFEDKLTITLLMYYAKTVFNVVVPHYHYNRENENSYMGKKEKYGYNASIFKEEKRNLLAVEEFFTDKETEYYHQSIKANTHFFRRKLSWSLKNSSKLIFDECVNYLYKSSPLRRALSPSNLKEKIKSFLCKHFNYNQIRFLYKLASIVK